MELFLNKFEDDYVYLNLCELIFTAVWKHWSFKVLLHLERCFFLFGCWTVFCFEFLFSQVLVRDVLHHNRSGIHVVKIQFINDVMCKIVSQLHAGFFFNLIQFDDGNMFQQIAVKCLNVFVSTCLSRSNVVILFFCFIMNLRFPLCNRPEL